jgi:hypothetical protein
MSKFFRILIVGLALMGVAAASAGCTGGSTGDTGTGGN